MAEAKKVTKAKTTKKAAKEAELIVEAVPEKAPAKSSKPKTSKSATVASKEATNGSIQEDSQESSTEGSPEVESEANSQQAAKAGKRSAKALKETEEKTAKEERKTSGETAEPKARPAAKPARSRLERRGAKFRNAAKLVDSTKVYSLSEALGLATKTSPVKFDASVEMHVNLNVDPRQADQNIRGTLMLPAGTGKTVRIAVFTEDTKVEGADVSGTDAISKSLEKGEITFDVLIATPATMGKLSKYARLLGPRGLMPNPKSGTVTTDVAKAVQEAKAGRVEYRVDSTGIVHLAIGKVSFGPARLAENAQAVLASIRSSKPASLKGAFISGLHISTSMGPSIRVTTE
jgi:large subunit ribosomal protein L1